MMTVWKMTAEVIITEQTIFQDVHIHVGLRGS